MAPYVELVGSVMGLMALFTNRELSRPEGSMSMTSFYNIL
jgi:hypothetical protein